MKPDLSLGLESVFDKSVIGSKQEKQRRGFGKSGLKLGLDIKRRRCHILCFDTKQLLSVVKSMGVTPASFLVPVFSEVLLESMNSKKNVRSKILIDLRKALGISSMHNCILTKEITYLKSFKNAPFKSVVNYYNDTLKEFRKAESLIEAATNQVNEVKHLVRIKNKHVSDFLAKIVAHVLKYNMGDFTFSYLGRIEMDERVMKRVEWMNARSWTDFGECNVAALDLNGKFIINVVENYVDEDIIYRFIMFMEKHGIIVEEIEKFDYIRVD